MEPSKKKSGKADHVSPLPFVSDAKFMKPCKVAKIKYMQMWASFERERERFDINPVILAKEREDTAQAAQELAQKKDQLSQKREELTQKREELTQTRVELTQWTEERIQTREELAQMREEIKQERAKQEVLKRKLAQRHAKLSKIDALKGPNASSIVAEG